LFLRAYCRQEHSPDHQGVKTESVRTVAIILKTRLRRGVFVIGVFGENKKPAGFVPWVLLTRSLKTSNRSTGALKIVAVIHEVLGGIDTLQSLRIAIELPDVHALNMGAVLQSVDVGAEFLVCTLLIQFRPD
jgi:hypothetical protein